jgi:phosphatidylglycerophosphate synthase
MDDSTSYDAMGGAGSPDSGDLVGLVDARGEAAWRVVGGIPLATRLVRAFERLGLRRIVVVCERPLDTAEIGGRDREARVESVRRDPERALGPDLLPDLEGDVLAVDGRIVVDRRVLEAMRDAQGPVCVNAVPPAQGESGRLRLARLPVTELARLGGPQEEAPAALLDPASLSTWALEMRGHVPILLLDAATPAAARVAGEALVRDTQKHVMDAPARWVDPWVEDALVRRVAPTRITPNQITVFCLFVGLLAAWWLYQGWWALAMPLLFIVGWLDGIDGKLARLRLHYSKMGAGESYFDFAYENAWWIALTVHFAGGEQGAIAGWLGAAWVAANLLDEINYTLADAWLGRSIDLLSRADGAFRLIAGRRNIYVYILAAAWLAGSVWAGFVVCSLWAVVTATVHALRLGVAAGSPESEGLNA